MKNFLRVFSLSTIALTLGSGPAYAFDQQDCDSVIALGHQLYPATCEQGSGKTREQVAAELVQAQRNGDIVSRWSFTERELSHGTIATTTVASGKTREQVKAELAEAQKKGDIPIGFVHKTEREIYSGNYPQATNLAQQGGGKTREQFEAEFVAAKKASSAFPEN